MDIHHHHVNSWRRKIQATLRLKKLLDWVSDKFFYRWRRFRFDNCKDVRILKLEVAQVATEWR